MYALAWASLALAAGTLLASLDRPGLGLLYLSTAASGLAIVFVVVALARRPRGTAGTGPPVTPGGASR